MPPNATSVPRRSLLRAVGVAFAAGVAGCTDAVSEAIGPTDEQADKAGGTPADDDASDARSEDETGGKSADDGADESPADDGDQQVVIADDFDSHVSETWVRQEHPDGSVVTIEMYTEWDLANDRTYRRVETTYEDGEEDEDADREDDDQVPVMEYYVVEDTTYQIRQDGCVSFDARLIRRGELREADVRIPDARDFETADNVEHVGTDTIDGEEVEVWQFDLGESFAHDGEMTVNISSDTGYVVLIDSWYDTGHADDPMTISFERRNYDFDEELDIEPPETCEQ